MSSRYAARYVATCQDALLAVTLLAAIVSAANGLMLSAIDRRGEHAALRTIGASRRQLAGSLRVELFAATLLAAGLGIGIGLAVAYWQVRLDPRFTAFEVPASTVASVAAVGVVVSLAAAELPARWVARRSIIEGLRSPG